jgi:hypothetical protein
MAARPRSLLVSRGATRTLSIVPGGATQIRQAGANERVGIVNGPFLQLATQINCSVAPYWTLIPAWPGIASGGEE